MSSIPKHPSIHPLSKRAASSKFLSHTFPSLFLRTLGSLKQLMTLTGFMVEASSSIIPVHRPGGENEPIGRKVRSIAAAVPLRRHQSPL